LPSLIRLCSALFAVIICFGLGSVPAAAEDCSPVRFNVAPTFGTEKTPASVAVADFNEDGAPDLAVANYGAQTFSIFNGDGEGAFLPPRSYPVGIGTVSFGTSPRALAVSDFNGDGNLDLVVVGGLASGWVSIVMGIGAGNFAVGMIVTTGVNGSAVTVGDFNGDGKKDIAVAGGDSRKVSFLLGNGTGSFTLAGSVSMTSDPGAITTGDFNGDGITDVAVTGRYFNWNSSIILGNSAGTFTVHHTFTMHWAPYSIASADFNGDGRADLAITYSWSSPEHGVAILLGDGTGRFGAAHEIFIGYEPLSVVTGDFNADGKTDLAVSVSGANSIAILQGNGAGTFSSPKYYGTAVGPSQLAAGDFNNDGKLDLTSVHPGSDVVSILLGNGAGAFASTTTELKGGGQIASADFNGDGLLDLAATGFSTIGTFLSNGTGGFTHLSSHQVVNYPKSIITQDFNNDGKPDLAVGHEYSTTISILLGDGTGNFSSQASFSLNGGLGVLTGGDFNGDNKADLAILTNNFAGTLGQVAILLGNGTGFFSAPASFAAGGVPNALTAADLNADGRLDLAVNNSYLGTVTVLLNDGGGSFSQTPYSPMRAAPKVDFIMAADLNRDGLPDLITANDEPHTVSILLNNGSGFAAVKTLTFNPGSSPRSVRVGDFNADGNPDLVVSVHNFFSDYHAGNVAVYTGDGAGNFSAPSFFTAGGGARDFVPADFNRDGKLDLAVAGTPITSPNLTVLLNTFAAQPCLTVNDVQVTEGDTGLTSTVFTVSLSAASAETVKVNYFLKDNTAKKDVDFYPVSGRLEFAPGETTRTVIVAVTNDTLDEFDKNFYFVLSNPAHAVIGKSQGLGTILDNDPEPVINIEDVSNTEAAPPGGFGSSILFTATLSAPSAKEVSFKYAFSGGTAILNTDYFPQSFTTITFPAGTTTMKFGVTIAADEDYELDETFFLDLSNPVNATFARTRIQGTIVNDDPPPLLSVDFSNPFANEGNSGTTDFPVFVQLYGASYQTVTVNYSTADNSAVAGSDYLSTSGTLTFNPGETRKQFNVQIIGDTIDEVDKMFTVNLSGATNATISSPQVVVVIRDDDGPNISVNDVSVTEGNTGARNATFTLSLSAISVQSVAVNYTTADGTATGGSDYVRAFARFASVPAGQLSATFNIPIVGDLAIEPDETFNVNLFNATGGTIIDSLGVGTILNDDSAPSSVQFGQLDYQFGEGAGSATLTVTRSGDKSGEVRVKYRTLDDPAAVPCDPQLKRPDGTSYPQGTAYARCDYATSVDSLTFLPGEESKQITIPLIDDAYQEGTETVHVGLFDVVGAVFTDAPSAPSAALHIEDNDPTTGTENPSRSTSFFVRMHYLDFLSREPEPGEPWSGVLNGCGNQFNLDAASPFAACDRLIVSQSFFGSPEFRLKGFYSFIFYRVGLNRRPSYEEIIPDMRSVTGQNGAEVFAKRAQFATDFAARHEFQTQYATLSDIAFVNALLDRYNLQQITTPDPQEPEGDTRVTLTRAQLVARLGATGAQALTRAQVLRAVVESLEVGTAEYNGAFVAMQYYGYLRRTPEESGYQAWLRVINQDPNNIRIMVNGFLNSTEYRIRFGRP
jgi:hypothetical protein